MMSISLRLTKCFVFSFNILCLILGIGVIAVNALGLEHSLPGTDEHLFFIVGIILSSLVCMTTLFGCYGVIGELLGVNIIYSFFILILSFMQYLQMENYPTRSFYINAVERLEHSWNLIETQPYSMSLVEKTYNCCGLYDSRDYNYKGLKTPKSCYSQGNERNAENIFERGCLEVLHDFYQNAIHREKLCNFALLGAQCIVLVGSLILSILLYFRWRANNVVVRREPARPNLVPPHLNHVGSRIAMLGD